jgi:hypothetical protein
MLRNEGIAKIQEIKGKVNKNWLCSKCCLKSLLERTIINPNMPLMLLHYLMLFADCFYTFALSFFGVGCNSQSAVKT